MSDLPTAETMGNEFYRVNLSRFTLIAPNVYLDWAGGEMDLFCLRKSGYVDEIEIKRSVADFRADFRKTIKRETLGPREHWRSWSAYGDHPKHMALRDGEAFSNRFSFLMPEEIANKVDIPHYAGLYVYRNDRVTEIKRAPLLHKGKLSEAKQIEIGRKMCYRYWSVRREERKAQ